MYEKYDQGGMQDHYRDYPIDQGWVDQYRMDLRNRYTLMHYSHTHARMHVCDAYIRKPFELFIPVHIQARAEGPSAEIGSPPRRVETLLNPRVSPVVVQQFPSSSPPLSKPSISCTCSVPQGGGAGSWRRGSAPAHSGPEGYLPAVPGVHYG